MRKSKNNNFEASGDLTAYFEWEQKPKSSMHARRFLSPKPFISKENQKFDENGNSEK